MLLKDIISEGRKILSAVYPEREADRMVSDYMEDVFDIRRYQHVMKPDTEISHMHTLMAKRDFARMAKGEPLQYVTGKAYFYCRQFRVTPDVLIPRQETELLCRSLICRNDKPINILDLCTGSGCIAWTLALEMPGAAVTAVDISKWALEVASLQDFEEEMKLSGAVKPRFVKADVLNGPRRCLGLRSAIGPVRQKFDIIVSNPPYVMDSEKSQMRANVLDYEPHLALFVPDDDPLKFYRAVARWAEELLADDGVGMVEINEALGKETAEVFVKAGFSQVEIVKDLNEKDRFVRFAR